MADFKITQEQADQLAEFLIGLDPKWLTLEWTRGQLRDFFLDRFERRIHDDQASSILYCFRDYGVVRLAPVAGSYGTTYRWERVQPAQKS
jgi:hypothetical protein